MMAGSGLLKGPSPAYLKFPGSMMQAFNILTDSMKKKGNQPLLEHGKFKQTYSDAADELKSATDFKATEFDTQVAQKVNSDLTATVAPDTPKDLVEPMKEIVDICSNYLAQHAEFSKHKGKAFHALVKAMKDKGGQLLYKNKRASRTMGEAAKELEKAKGLNSQYDDPNLSQEIHGKLSALPAQTQDDKSDLADTLDRTSKYLSERAVYQNERGPAFDHMIKTLEKTGGKSFATNPHPNTRHAAAAALKSSPPLSSASPDTETAPEYKTALHKAVDASTPPAMADAMKNTISKAADDLSAFARDRGNALKGIVAMMKSNPTKEAAKRNNYTMNYGDGAAEIENAPNIVSYLPVKDIADEVKGKLSADMENKVPPELIPATKTAVDDCANNLSQSIALRSGAAGERYPRNLLGAIMKSFGDQPLFKDNNFGMSYADAAKNLEFAGPLESDPNSAELASEISAELNHKILEKLSPELASSLQSTGIIDEAAKHLAKSGRNKGKALEHLTNLMGAKGDKPLGVLQGYEQTYDDGARRLTNAPSLANDKVDKGAYEKVSAKLHALHQESPMTEHHEHMPGIIEESAKYLSRPSPENEEEKRKVLADLMGRKGNEEFDKEKASKLTYKEAADEIQNAPVGATSSKNQQKAAENEAKLNSVIPEKKLQELLKSAVKEGAAHLADTVGQAGAGGSTETEEQRRKRLSLPPETDAERAERVEAERRQKLGLPPETDQERAERRKKQGFPPESEEERSDRLEAERRKKQGLPPETGAKRADRLEAERRKKLGLAPETDQERAERRKKQGFPPESEEERSDRLEAERREKQGLPPETGAEGADRLEAERRKKLGLPPETDQERAERRKKQGFPPESEEERSDRLEAERRKKQGLPPETGADRADRLEAERRKKLGLPPETEVERLERKKLEKNQSSGAAADALASTQAEAQRRKALGLPPETDEERSDRLEVERREKLGLPPETKAERLERKKQEEKQSSADALASTQAEAQRRKALGLPPETDEERSDRLEAERREKLGLPPETKAERLERKKQEEKQSSADALASTQAEAQRRKALGLPPETDEERSDRLEAEKRKKLGLPPETEAERLERKKLEKNQTDALASTQAEAQRRKALGLPPETDEERSDRLEVERREKLGLPPETEVERLERKKQEEKQSIADALASTQAEAQRRKALGLPPETDEERSDRLEAEKRKKLGLPPETEEERDNRLEVEKRKRLGLPPETEEERGNRREAKRRKRQGLPQEAEEERRTRQKLERDRRRGGAGGDDPERDAALHILHSQLKAKGDEIFYKQPHTELTHSKASEWLEEKPPFKVDKTVRESGDAARLSKKFEKKLSNLVVQSTPPTMQDTMQDVVIESSRNLAERFVSKNYKTLVKEGLISEMQKKGNEILVEDNGAAETCFFAAQRLKKVKPDEAIEPCDRAAYYISKKLDDIIRSRTIARKLTGIMKEHIKEASVYLSGLVTKPDPDIEAYVALLGEMEITGDALLIEGDIPKSYEASAAYLRTLTTYEDQINRPDPALQSATESKLRNIMANVPLRGYENSHMSNAIKYATKLLVSYIKLQGEKTEALKFLTERLKEGGSGVLLRHGVICKSYADGADILKGKNADELKVTSAEPVVARKIQIKLVKLVHDGTVPAKFQGLIDDLIEDTTLYLAVNLLQPRVIQVCKCMKNVFVQCELWCDEILRRLARPCCTCSRHVSAAALSDLSPPGRRLRITADQTSAVAPGVEISIKTCPSHRSRSRSRHVPREHSSCFANVPTPDCPGNTNRNYNVQYSTCEHSRFDSPRHYQPSTNFADYQPTTSANYEMTEMPTSSKKPHITGINSLLFDVNAKNHQFLVDEEKTAGISSLSSESTPSYHTPYSTAGGLSDTKSPPPPFWQTRTTMLTTMETSAKSHTQASAQSRTPIVSTDQMADWHAMMVSLMWNVQAWRGWIQENINRALGDKRKTVVDKADTEENWVVFQRRVSTEALQWRQYNIFSRQLTLRLAMRYKDKQIVSPTRATNQTGNYLRCQVETLEIIEMFNRWTQWLTAVVQETNSLSQSPGYAESIDEARWIYFKDKVVEYLDDWKKYNNHLKACWENNYKTNMTGWMPAWRQPGPVWVVSACGAVPSGAVLGGWYDNEMIWVARTTHRCNVLPAALHPSKHCCVVYAEGAVHHYTKYQVMCNAEVQWQAWRSGRLGARAVRVAPGTHVGRVHYRGSHLIGAVSAPNYRCHVVIFGRPFAFNCYELLVLKKDEVGTLETTL